MTQEVPLSNGLVALIDEEDFPLVSRFTWWEKRSRHSSYAYTQANRRTVLMHRLIVGAEKGQLVDHINGDGLDNRRCNLRFATWSLNTANSRARASMWGLRGIVGGNGRGYRAECGARPNRWRSKTFDCPVQAAIAYDREAVRRFGQYARPNFPCIVRGDA